jgi:hypothetical protein
MTKQLLIQSNFSHGELDPRVFDVTLDLYYKSAQYVRNLYVRPQGGVLRRHGTIYKNTIDADADKIKLGSYIHDTENAYLLVWIDQILNIYKEDSSGLTLKKTIASPYTADEVRDVQFTQVGQTLYSVYPSYMPYQLTRGADDTNWTYAAIVFQNDPVNDFDNAFINSTFTLKSVATGKDIVLTTDVNTFSAAYVGGVFLSIGDSTNASGAAGLARITEYTNATSVKVTIINPFDSSLTSGVKGNHCYLAEPIYSATRGYPASVGTSQSRLCFGGADQTPNIIVMSKINSPLNFNVLDGADPDAALSYTLPGQNHNKIEWIMSNQSVQIFGSSDTFSTTSSLLDSANMAFSLQTDKGASSKCAPQTLDNEVFYVQNGGKAVMRHVFNPQSGTYTSVPVSTFAAHLIKDPIASAVLGGDSLDDADYLFLVNSDGSLAVLQSLAVQNVLGWSLCGTGEELNVQTMNPNHGKFKDIVAINNEIYVLVERKINNHTEIKQYIEKLSFDVRTDCTITQVFQEDQTVIQNLNALEGLPVKVWADGFLLDDQTVDTGQITIERPSSNVSVGLNYNVQLTPLPVNILGSHAKYLPKRIVRTWVSYYDSIGIYVDGTPIPELRWQDQILDTPTTEKSGWYDARLEGWDPQKTYDITQQDPLPFYVLGLGFEVEL